MGFLSPYALFFLSLLGPVIWFYLWREKKQVILVSSIIPWRYLSAEQSAEAKAFRIDWQLILQLLVIILATLALSRLYFKQIRSFKYQVLIIDTSASMATLNQQGISRLEAAQRKALEFINQTDSQTQLALIEMAGTVTRLQDFTKNKMELKRLVQELKPREEGTKLQEAVNLARASLAEHGEGNICLISDGGQWLLEDPGIKKQLTLVKVGESTDNLAITSLDSYQGLYAQHERVVYIRVANLGGSPREAGLRISLNGELLDSAKLILLPNSHQNYPLTLSDQKGLLKAELLVEDALSADNQAYLLLRDEKALSVLLVTPDPQMEADFARLAAATGNLKYDWVPPEEFGSVRLASYRLAIFHQSAPTELLPIDCLFIAPPAENVLWTVSVREIKNPQILDWDRWHPTLKYLDFLDKMALKTAQDVQLPPWGNPLIGTPDFPLAFWGEEEGFKQLAFCFDLQPLLFPASQDISGIILFLNSLDWLASSSFKGGAVKTGEAFLLATSRPLKQVTVINPRGEKQRFNPQGKNFNYAQTQYVGLYKVQTEDMEGHKKQYTFVANLFDEAEAQLMVKESLSPDPQAAPVSAGVLSAHEEPRELWRYLLLVAILCLLCEWWLYLRD